MIENDRQLEITRIAINRFKQALTRLRGLPPPNVHPWLHRAHRAAVREQLSDLQAEVRQYTEGQQTR